MFQRFPRFALLLALPLLLGAALAFAQQKQKHPTATARDLGERAHLSQAVIVNMAVDGEYISIPPDEFKQTLEEFYLVKQQEILGSLPEKAIFVARLDKDQSVPLGTIEVGIEQHYSSYYSAKSGNLDLHPATERRLRELVAKYRPAR